MKYKNVVKGEFLERPNRFIAICKINGETEVCHVKNTGRCKELLVKGATVFLEKSSNLNRKTKYDLIAVKKGDRLINMDSQVPNFAVLEYLPKLFDDIEIIKPECKYGNSRLIFLLKQKPKKYLLK